MLIFFEYLLNLLLPDLMLQCQNHKSLPTFSQSQLILILFHLDPSSDHLKQIMADHGGRYQHYYSMKSCTHIIATNLPDSKVKNLK